MFAILYVPSNTIIDACFTEDAARRFVTHRLCNPENFTVRRITLEDALSHLHTRNTVT